MEQLKRWLLLQRKNISEKEIRSILKHNKNEAIDFLYRNVKTSRNLCNSYLEHPPYVQLLVILTTGSYNDKRIAYNLSGKCIQNIWELSSFLYLTRQRRGFGYLIHKIVNRWFRSNSNEFLKEELLKSQDNGFFGWHAKDILKLFHIKPRSEKESEMFAKFAKGEGQYV